MKSFLALIVLAVCAFAQDPALVRSQLQKDSVWAGERVELQIELFVPFRFSGTPSFELPEVDGAVILRSGANSGRPILGTKRIEGEDYVSALYRFAVFFQRAGRFDLEPFPVRFGAIAAFGEEPAEQRVLTQPMSIEVRMPPGAEELRTILATSRLEVRQTWEPEPSDVKVGAAFQRTVTLAAPDIPGLLLPELPLEQVSLLDVYPGDPSVETDMQRGEYRGKRVEHVTYLCARAGVVEIPELVLTWWNTQSKKLERTTLAGASFEVLPTPSGESPGLVDDPDSSGEWTQLVTLVVLAVFAALVSLLVWLVRSPRSRQGDGFNEPELFRELEHSLKQDDAAASLRALYDWLQRRSASREVATLKGLRVTSAELAVQLSALEDAVLAGERWSGAELCAQLRDLRSRERDRSSAAAKVLPPLNPRA